MVQFRTLLAIFSGLVALIATVLVPAAYFGDNNESWAKRLTVIAFVACCVFLLAVFW